MGEIFTFLPKLSVDQIIKKWVNSYIKVVEQLIKFVKRNKYNQQMDPMYVEKETGRNNLSCVCFSNILYVINSFPSLKYILENKIYLFLSPQVQDRLNGKMNIFFNFIHTW